ncbi:hypothetical protein [uncultured Methanospirillum sp.]|uniref:hypothetical protein n=1 Tax=uncultured Methanospirillum sp. TaxID=262503 RepID=UPI0029C97F5E|nr:hypothetical protein [uncultured Methanospirillum sp.]
MTNNSKKTSSDSTSTETKDLYVITSNPKNFKGKSVLLLEEQLRNQGYSVAILYMCNGFIDTHNALQSGRYHYSIPIEAAKSREAFEAWVPVGYDKYILEVTLPYSPIGAAYLDLFQSINEVIPYDLKDSWKEHILDPQNSFESLEIPFSGDISPMWDIIHNRTVQTIISKSPIPLNGPYLDTTPALINPDLILKEQVTPRMQFPHSEKKVLAFGPIPAEYWDIYPGMVWNLSEYDAFRNEFLSGNYDYVILGTGYTEELKTSEVNSKYTIISYQLPLGQGASSSSRNITRSPNLSNVFQKIKNGQRGDSLTSCHCAYEEYSDKYWIKKKVIDKDLIWTEKNIVYCNGWVVPQYLILEGLLEVN